LSAGLFDETLSACEDWDLWMRLAEARYCFVSVPDALVIYRRYSASMSRNHARMWRNGLTVLSRNVVRHKHCPHCGQASMEGRQFLRRYCFYACVESAIDEPRRRGDIRGSLIELRRALLIDPGLIGFLVDRKLHHWRAVVLSLMRVRG